MIRHLECISSSFRTSEKASCSKERQLVLWHLYNALSNRYTTFRPNNRSKGGAAMDLKAVGQRIKIAREAKNLTQEDLAEIVDLSPTHMSVIERGVKVPKLDTFVAIANALDVSADALLIDVVTHSTIGVATELSETISKLPIKEQKKILKAVKVLAEE